jgi:hypothetical protein
MVTLPLHYLYLSLCKPCAIGRPFAIVGLAYGAAHRTALVEAGRVCRWVQLARFSERLLDGRY